MATIDTNRIISMAQLQKMSSKMLAKYGTPLFIMDFKSKRTVFVVVDMDVFARMTDAMSGTKDSTQEPAVAALRHGRRKNKEEIGVHVSDYRKMGLLWDRPDMTNEEFDASLKNSQDANNLWVLKRFLEYAPSEVVTKALTLEELIRAVGRVPLRPVYKEAWSRAVRYWSENP